MINGKSYVAALVLLLMVFSYESYSQNRVYNTSRVTGNPPVIDGVINDEAWEKVSWSGNFLQREPYEGQPATQKTDIKILYDNNNLYVAIRLWDNDASKIERRLTRRDSWEGDWVAFGVDSYNDDLTAFVFAVSAAGVKNDAIITNDTDPDDTWDPVWYTKVSIDDEGWSAEMKIPYNQIRFADVEDHVWGMEVLRYIFREQEESLWELVPQNAAGWVSRWGTLEGINNIKPKKEIEIVPYGMVKFETYEKEEGNPFKTGSDFGYNAGVDGKVAITNDLTLNYSINPDFGQVEADPSEVNLSAFETFFEEKRPFFIEGSSIYNYSLTQGDGPFSSDNLFYSRRIGTRPHYEPDISDGEYMKSPEFTTILGAVKLSGKTQNGLSIGVLESLTKEEKAIIDSNGERRAEVIEPTTNFFNTRIQKDYNKGNTQIGGMVTATNRFINDSTLEFLPNSAYTGGLDFANFWDEKSYYLSARATMSVVTGTKEAMTEIQESPQHYFQRPDAKHLSVDTNLTSLMGSGGTIEGGKIGGGHWSYGGWTTWRSPGLELNDMGYLRSSDFVNQILWGGYRIWEPFSIFRRINFNAATWHGWDFSGLYLYSGGNLNVNMQFTNYWRLGTGVNREGFDIDRHELRGGPALRTPGSWNSWISISTDERKKLEFSIMAMGNWGDDSYRKTNRVSFEVEYRPFDFIELELEPSYNFSNNYMIYIDTFDNEDNTSTYLVSSIDKEFVSMDIRINVGITPDLSIQFWGQPFLFSGNYSQFRKVTNAMAANWKDQYYSFKPDQVDFNAEADEYIITDGNNTYNFENPDFSFYEFRSNFVIRWEYIPGSTAYLVWSQGRTGDHPDGRFSLSDNISRLSDLTPHNVFLLKFSYRFSF